MVSYLAYLMTPDTTQNQPGLGSVRRDDKDSKTLEMVSAGLHWSFNMSRQMEPFALMFGW